LRFLKKNRGAGVSFEMMKGVNEQNTGKPAVVLLKSYFQEFEGGVVFTLSGI